MKKKNFLKSLKSYVKESLKNDKSGHGYAHTKRVFKNALKIAKYHPEADKEVLITSCWLHDIAFKDGFVKDHHLAGAEQAKKFLENSSFPKKKIDKVVIAIEDHIGLISKPVRPDKKLQIESKILRDADNLDAIGKIGLKRAIDFNKSRNRPEIISLKDGFNESLYGSLKSIVTWPNKMLTREGKEMGKRKAVIMQNFLKKLEKKLK